MYLNAKNKEMEFCFYNQTWCDLIYMHWKIDKGVATTEKTMAQVYQMNPFCR